MTTCRFYKLDLEINNYSQQCMVILLFLCSRKMTCTISTRPPRLFRRSRRRGHRLPMSRPPTTAAFTRGRPCTVLSRRRVMRSWTTLRIRRRTTSVLLGSTSSLYAYRAPPHERCRNWSIHDVRPPVEKIFFRKN